MLNIFDGANVTGPTATFCGNEVPADFRSEQSTVKIQMKTDSSVNGPGFNLTWSTLDEVVHPCGSVITDFDGILTSPGYPGNYADDVNCLWIINIPGQVCM